jgi:hypothetical protein
MNKWKLYVLFFYLGIIIFSNVNAQNFDSIPSVFIQDSIYQNNVASSENYDFKEPGHENTVAARKVADAKLKELKEDKDYWYVDKVPSGDREVSPPGVNQKGEKERQERMVRARGFIFPSWLRVLFWIILIGGFLTLLIWFLSTSDIRLFRKKQKQVKQQPEEQAGDDIFEMNFEKEIQKAIEAKNFRLAVRLMYLRTLKDLCYRNLINYTHEKTNSDYLFQLTGTAYYKNFFKLTRSFDYIWYGRFELSEDSFVLIQNDFSSFKQQLSS